MVITEEILDIVKDLKNEIQILKTDILLIKREHGILDPKRQCGLVEGDKDYSDKDDMDGIDDLFNGLWQILDNRDILKKNYSELNVCGRRLN